MIYSICYFSTASLDLSLNEVESLFDFTVEFNDSHNISGVLVYKDRNFMQIIEGEKNIILDLFERIENDNRHKDIITLFNGEIKNKIFEEYDISFTVIKDMDRLTKLNRFFEIVKESDDVHVNKVLNLVSNFISINK